MPEGHSATRTGVTIGLSYSAPLFVWLLGQSLLIGTGQASPENSLEMLLSALVLLQACALALCLPWLLRYPSPVDQACAATLLLLVPLPLYVITWLGGGADLDTLVRSLLWLLIFSLLLQAVYRACLAIAPAGHLRALPILGLQLLLLGCGWHYRAYWQGLLGL